MENYYCYSAILLSVLVIIWRLFPRQNPKLPPCPPALPIVGHFHLIKKSLHQALVSLSSKHGPIFSLRLGCRSFVVVSSPSAIEECFTKNDILFANRPKSVAGDRLTYNYTALAWIPYGHFWRVLRRLTTIELFSTKSLQKSSIVREEEIGLLLRLLFKASNKGGQKVDLNYWISIFTVNLMMKIVAGKHYVAEEDATAAVGKQIIADFRKKFFTSVMMNPCDFFPVLRWVGYKGLERKLVLMHNERNEFLQGLLDEFRRERSVFSESSTTMKGTKQTSMVETLLSLQQSEPDFYSEDLIKSLLLIMFIAGTETSSATIEWAMSLLLTHPEALHKLRAEIDRNVGQERLITDSDFSNLPYLRCVINETLRMYPPVPLLLPHYSSEDCTLGGYEIPQGTTILINAWAVHKDPKIWEAPNKFRPERFEDVEGKGSERFNYKFIPFGMGRRACPGTPMGLRTISLALGALIQCFDWKNLGQDETDLYYTHRVVLQKAKPLEALCIPRTSFIHLLSRNI